MSNSRWQWQATEVPVVLRLRNGVVFRFGFGFGFGFGGLRFLGSMGNAWVSSETDDILNIHTLSDNHTWLPSRMLSEDRQHTAATHTKKKRKTVVQFLTWVSQTKGHKLRWGSQIHIAYVEDLLSISFGRCMYIGKPQEHQLMADKLNFAVLNGQSMRRFRTTGGLWRNSTEKLSGNKI